MKKYDVTLIGHYEKTIAVYADSPEQAAEKVRIILCDTDLIDFSDDDSITEKRIFRKPMRKERQKTEPMMRTRTNV